MLPISEQIEQQLTELSRAIAATSVVADVAHKLDEDLDSGKFCDNCKQLIDSKPDWYDAHHQKSLALALDVLSSHTDAVYSRLENLQIKQKEGTTTEDSPDFKQIAAGTDEWEKIQTEARQCLESAFSSGFDAGRKAGGEQ